MTPLLPMRRWVNPLWWALGRLRVRHTTRQVFGSNSVVVLRFFKHRVRMRIWVNRSWWGVGDCGWGWGIYDSFATNKDVSISVMMRFGWLWIRVRPMIPLLPTRMWVYLLWWGLGDCGSGWDLWLLCYQRGCEYICYDEVWVIVDQGETYDSFVTNEDVSISVRMRFGWLWIRVRPMYDSFATNEDVSISVRMRFGWLWIRVRPMTPLLPMRI